MTLNHSGTEAQRRPNGKGMKTRQSSASASFSSASTAVRLCPLRVAKRERCRTLPNRQPEKKLLDLPNSARRCDGNHAGAVRRGAHKIRKFLASLRHLPAERVLLKLVLTRFGGTTWRTSWSTCRKTRCTPIPGGISVAHTRHPKSAAHGCAHREHASPTVRRCSSSGLRFANRPAMRRSS